MKIARFALNVFATLAIGYALSRWIDRLPYEFPPLPATITAAMSALGIDTIAHADAIEASGLLVIIAASLAVAALLVRVANRLFVHRRRAWKRRSEGTVVPRCGLSSMLRSRKNRQS
ncbi:hypothetical protein Bsp3421_002450 [Burkholderia sp. FERM BP-3421]|jgi:hypothetical protein|uniref:hypothetical protein n=1 Tax=Burkholderia sp. FERM BP-3421 TaxID=1494466 RepID=UPI0023619A38|nr:hypothetical protein [Burkholderia sp. FERM BP-3421]WDD92444.1 hypothetical protein Bsp3421_002450 [Burkholderia sp. FERM BP-3421]